jgi:hypothetical protein
MVMKCILLSIHFAGVVHVIVMVGSMVACTEMCSVKRLIMVWPGIIRLRMPAATTRTVLFIQHSKNCIADYKKNNNREHLKLFGSKLIIPHR